MPPNQSRTLRECIENIWARKAQYTIEDVAARVGKVVEMAVANGTTRLRSHVDVDPIGRLIPLQGVLVARNGKTWAGPAFYDLATASVGFQAGVEVSEAIIVVMTDKGLNSLLATTFKVGGDASIAAGPVGAGAKSTVTADLVSFTRAKGVYGGLNLDGTVVHANGDFNGQFYGAKGKVLPPDILIKHTYKSAKATPLLNAVAKVGGK